MKRLSLNVVAGALTLASLALFTASADAQYRHQLPQHHHHNHNHRGGYQNSYYQNRYVAPLPIYQNQWRGDNCYYDRGGYQVQPYYGNPYQNSYYQQQSPGIGFGFQNRDFSLYIGR